MSNEYSLLIKRVEEIVIQYAYTIEVKSTTDNHEYEFVIKKNGEKISNVTIIIMDEKVKTSLRNTGTTDVDLFYISTVFTEEDYRGQYLALLLLIYGISHLKFKYPNIKYATLDDCSNRSSQITNNLYHSLGFVPRDEVSLDFSKSCKPTHLVLSGPEKQLNLDIFLQRANDAITAVQKIFLNRGTGIIKKKHKRIKKKTYKHRRKFHRKRRTRKK